MKPTPDWVKQLKPSGVQGHELLKAERENSNVPVQELEVLLHTQDVIDRRERILKILKAEKVFDKSQNYFMGRIDRFERALAREKRLRNLKKQHNWTTDEFQAAADLVGEPGPYGLHDTMFKVTSVLQFRQRHVNAPRLHSRARPHLSSKKSGSQRPTNTKSSAAMLKPSLAMAPTSVDWRQQPLGTRKTRPSPFTRHILPLANGGLAH